MADFKTVLSNTVKYGVPVAVAVLFVISAKNCSGINNLREDVNEDKRLIRELQDNNAVRDSLDVKRDSLLLKMIDGIDAVEKRVSKTEGRIDTLENRLDELEERVDTIKSCKCDPVVTPVVPTPAPVTPAPVTPDTVGGDTIVVHKNVYPISNKPTVAPVYEEPDASQTVGNTVIVGGENSGNITVGNGNTIVNGDGSSIVIVNEAAPQPTSYGFIRVRRVISRNGKRTR